MAEARPSWRTLVEPGKARKFFEWLQGTRPQYVGIMVDNEMFDWDTLAEMDAENLGYMDITDSAHQGEIVSKILELNGGCDGIESGRAERFHEWVALTYPTKNISGLLQARGKVTWAALSSLTRADLVDIGIRALGVQKKVLKQVTLMNDEADASAGDAALATEEKEAPRNGPRPRVGLVLLGETGAGKSTFYQSLMDHAQGKSFSQIRETERNPDVKESESQTKISERHEYVSRNYVLHVIDTPGIGDTMGVEEDQRHVENITKFLSEDCDFNAICMVIKNGANRATARMQYIVNEIKSHLTRDVWPHVFTVVTRCAQNRFPGDDTITVIELLGLPSADDEARFFLIDNYAYERVEERRRPRGYMQAKERAYEEAGEQLEKIIEAALRLPMKTGHTIGKLRTHRLNCKEKALVMQAKIDSMNNERKQMQDAEEEIKKCRSIKDLNKNYKGTTTHMRKVAKTMPNGGKATTCGVCHRRCHDPCHVTTQGDISSCCAISGDSCNQCYHAKDSHNHTNQYFVDEPYTQQTLDTNAKRRYDNAVGMEQKKQVLVATFRDKISRLEREKEQLTRQIAHIYCEIDTLAVESFNEFFPKYVKELISEVEKKRLPRDEKDRQIADLRRQIEMYDENKRAFAARNDVGKRGRGGRRTRRNAPSRQAPSTGFFSGLFS